MRTVKKYRFMIYHVRCMIIKKKTKMLSIYHVIKYNESMTTVFVVIDNYLTY